ncbi:MAG: FxsA family protein [Candidatus Bipolaricaulia bacterium]
MFFKLLAVFVAVPLVELYLLLLVGRVIGAFWTVLIVVLTGVLGGFLAKREGLAVLRRVRERLDGGELPGDELLDGAIILISGALLITPGMVTDLLGLLGLLPLTRRWFKQMATRRFRRSVRRGAIDVEFKIEDR